MRGQAISREDILNHRADALQAALYTKVQSPAKGKGVDKTYADNKSFWADALAAKHLPGSHIILDNFHLTEWLPFAPGRYFTPDAGGQRELAAHHVARDRDEYTPEGKASMVRGGVGAIRLAEKKVEENLTYFLGASSNGIAHQGIPIAMLQDEYNQVMPAIVDHGGCRVGLVGRLRTMTEDLPQLYFGPSVPRYCFFTEEATLKKPSESKKLLTTAAIMFRINKKPDERWGALPTDDPAVVDKSWTFCSFDPGASKTGAQTAASWLYDYAKRYSRIDPAILTDFDEHYNLFSCPVEFPLKDIVRGAVNWETLRAYKKLYPGTYIDKYYEVYIKEYTAMHQGDKIDVHGSGNTIVNRSTVQNAFNRVAAKHDEDIAKALLQIETAINKSGNKDAAENFESFSDELAKPEPKKSLLKSLWQGTLAALPTLKELPDVIAKISSLFG